MELFRIKFKLNCIFWGLLENSLGTIPRTKIKKNFIFKIIKKKTIERLVTELNKNQVDAKFDEFSGLGKIYLRRSTFLFLFRRNENIFSLVITIRLETIEAFLLLIFS